MRGSGRLDSAHPRGPYALHRRRTARHPSDASAPILRTAGPQAAVRARDPPKRISFRVAHRLRRGRAGSHAARMRPRHGDPSDWLGREDSNLRMAESKSAALPLGYAPRIAWGKNGTYRRVRLTIATAVALINARAAANGSVRCGHRRRARCIDNRQTRPCMIVHDVAVDTIAEDGSSRPPRGCGEIRETPALRNRLARSPETPGCRRMRARVGKDGFAAASGREPPGAAGMLRPRASKSPFDRPFAMPRSDRRQRLCRPPVPV